MIGCGIYYICLIYRGEPVGSFATWFLFFVAVVVSLASYKFERENKAQINGRNLSDNIMNLCDAFIVTSIVIAIVATRGWSIFPISTTDKICVSLSLVMIVIWLIKRNHFTTNLISQFILFIAYFPTFSKLWYANTNEESFIMWGGIWLAGILSVAVAMRKKDLLATIYALRALVMVSIILILMLSKIGAQWKGRTSHSAFFNSKNQIIGAAPSFLAATWKLGFQVSLISFE